MTSVMDLIKARRTCRFYTEEQVSEEDLNKILEAGLWAPNAGNRQAQKFVVVQDKELNEELGKINKTGPINHATHNLTAAGNTASISAFYGAPTVVYIFTPSTYPNSMQDCCVAAENMLLMATELGVGCAYIARGETTFDSDLGQSCKEKWGLAENEQCHSIVLLGHPSKEFPPQDRKEGRILRF